MARKIFPNDTPSAVVAPDDRVLFADTSDSSNLKDSSVLEFVESWMSALTTDNLPEWTTNKYYDDALVSANTDVLNATNQRHTHWNKALLDTYTQTEVNIADAVSKKHTHANQAALDVITNAWSGTTFLSADWTYKSIAWDAVTAKQIAYTSQVLDTWIVNTDPVYFDPIAWKWKKSIWVSNLPEWLVEDTSTGKVVMFWRLISSWAFKPWYVYFYNSTTWGLTNTFTTATAYKVWFAYSLDELLIDIDYEYNLYSPTRAIWDNWYMLWGNSSATKIERLRFDNETTSTSLATVTASSGNNSWVNSSTAWYQAWTWVMTVASTILKMPFASEIFSTLSAALTQTRTQLAWLNSSTNWYFCYGSNASTTYYNRIDKLTYATDTILAWWVSIWTARRYPASVNSTTIWLLCWGYTWALSTEIDWINFSDNTINNPASVLSVARENAWWTNSSSDWYISGWFTTVYTTTNDKISLSTYTVSTIWVMAAICGWWAPVNNNTAWYQMWNGVSNTSIQKTLYSTDVSTALSAVLSWINALPRASFQSGWYL